VIAILGAGAIGSALAVQWARRHADVVLLATDHDAAALAAWRGHDPHPALGIPMPREVACHPPEEWAAALARADRVAVCVSTPGLRPAVVAAAAFTRPGTEWIIATKGWDPATLQAPSEVVADVAGDHSPVVTLGGPALAAEIIVGAPTALVAAARDLALAESVAASLRSTMLGVAITDDVAGTEIASAYKNVVAIAVGLCEGLTDRFGQSAVIHRFANARAAVFAQGLVDMAHLAEARGGRTATILGLAGSGDLFVTSLGGRNGRFGRLLGAGQSPDRALRAIGSTVEGVSNTAAALTLADRLSLDLPTARAVDMALREQLLGDEGLADLRELFRTAVAGHAGPLPV